MSRSGAVRAKRKQSLQISLTYRPAGFFILRCPLRPFADFQHWAIGDATDEQSLRQRLQRELALPHVREAIYTASPSLFARASSWLEGGNLASDTKTEHALV